MSAKSHQEKFGGQKDSPKPSQPCGQMLPILREPPKKEVYDIGARACHYRSKGMDWKNYSSYRLPDGCRRIDGRYQLISQQGLHPLPEVLGFRFRGVIHQKSRLRAACS